jgi:acetyl esterase/lipase
VDIERRRILSGGLAASLLAALCLPAEAFAQVAPDTPPPAWLPLVHPELRTIALQIHRNFASAPPPTLAALPQLRAGMRNWTVPPLAEVPYEVRRIAGSPGQPDVAIHIVNAQTGGSRPAILHTHGGGYIMGDAAGDINALQRLCRTLDCIAVSVDYRLAPETTYAGAIEDNYAGLKWLHANAASIGADPARIAVMGESAGGGHAALLAMTARDRGEVPLIFQCLVYPMLDDRTGSSRRTPAHVGQLIWTETQNRFGWQSFLGTAPGRARAPRGAVPARVNDLSGLPPAWIGVGSLDLFADEDVDYAQRLNAARVPAELLLVPGAFHGFDRIPSSAAIVEWFNARKVTALRTAFTAH